MVESKVEAISPVVGELMRTIKAHQPLHDYEFEIETAMRESLANAIVHGNQQNSCKRERICCACEEDGGVLIVVKDGGEGFDPSLVPSPATQDVAYPAVGHPVIEIGQGADGGGSKGSSERGQ